MNGPSSVGMSGGAIPAASGGTAVTEADGANVALGSTTDAESAAGNGTVVALLKRHRTLLGSIVVLLGAGLPAALVAGRLDISVGAFNAALPSGTNTIGRARAVDTLLTQLAGRLDSVRRVDTLRTQLAGRLDSVRRVDTVRALALLSAGRLDSVRRVDTAYARVSDSCVTNVAAANAVDTLSFAAVAGKFHYITYLWISRNATAALAGTATLALTSSNLPGTPQWRVGNAMVAGGTQIDVSNTFANPIKSKVVNTRTFIAMPAPGAAVLWTATACYYLGP